MSTASAPQSLKLLPVYLGVASLDEALRHPRLARILWLEILVNDAIDWTALEHPVVRQAYQTACRWHTTYRTLISCVARPAPRRPRPDRYAPVPPICGSARICPCSRLTSYVRCSGSMSTRRATPSICYKTPTELFAKIFVLLIQLAEIAMMS